MLTSQALLARMVDGRSLVITMFGRSAKSYTLEKAVIETAGLETKGLNLRLLELVNYDDERSDVMCAEVGATKPRPRLVGVLCSKCGSLLAGPHSYTRHRVLHDGDMIVCNDCHGAFGDKFYYRTHLNNCYFICPFVCQFRAKSAKDVKKHMMCKHRYDKIEI